MRVEALMTRSVATCRPEDTLDQVARTLWDGDCGCIPVVRDDDGGVCVVGMITDRDVCMAAYTQGRALADIRVSSAMEREVRSCGPRDTVRQALKILETTRLRRLPVIDDHDHLVGLLSLADVAREGARERPRSAKEVTAEAIADALEAISAPRSGTEITAAA
jgi:CBS domain-containing protein